MAMAFAVIAVALCYGFDISVVAERELSVALVDASENLFKNCSTLHVVSLTPSGNLSVCYNESVSLNCMTTNGPILWIEGSKNHLYNSFQDPVMLGILYLKVVSVNFDGVSLRVTSTATIDQFQFNSSGLTVECRETTSMNNSQTTLEAAGK